MDGLGLRLLLLWCEDLDNSVVVTPRKLSELLGLGYGHLVACFDSSGLDELVYNEVLHVLRQLADRDNVFLWLSPLLGLRLLLGSGSGKLGYEVPLSLDESYWILTANSVFFGTEPRESKGGLYLTTFEALSDLLLEYHKLVFHLRVDVPFLFRGPEAPESIANDVPEPSLLLLSEDVLPQLSENLGSLPELGV